MSGTGPGSHVGVKPCVPKSSPVVPQPCTIPPHPHPLGALHGSGNWAAGKQQLMIPSPQKISGPVGMSPMGQIWPVGHWLSTLELAYYRGFQHFTYCICVVAFLAPDTACIHQGLKFIACLNAQMAVFQLYFWHFSVVCVSITNAA